LSDESRAHIYTPTEYPSKIHDEYNDEYIYKYEDEYKESCLETNSKVFELKVSILYAFKMENNSLTKEVLASKNLWVHETSRRRSVSENLIVL